MRLEGCWGSATDALCLFYGSTHHCIHQSDMSHWLHLALHSKATGNGNCCCTPVMHPAIVFHAIPASRCKAVTTTANKPEETERAGLYKLHTEPRPCVKHAHEVFQGFQETVSWGKVKACGAGLPHAHLVEAVLKDMASTHSQAQAAIAPVVIPSGVNACPEVGALVVKLYEAGHLEEGTEGPLQQTGVLPQQGVQQSPVLLCKPAYVAQPDVGCAPKTVLHIVVQ